jgi:citrate synthase
MLIVCADHELNASSFTARCVASTSAPPYAVVSAGLAALQGPKHGGASERVASFLRSIRSSGQAREAVVARLRQGQDIPGFGHALYPQGDPRGRLLMDLLPRYVPRSAVVRTTQTVVEVVAELLQELPTVDFGLAALVTALGLPAGTALGLFALGRTVGWIGHAQEQYQSDKLIRPRARYIGPAPGQH